MKERFWTPHTQMFNILAPVVGMVLCRRVRTVGRLSSCRLLQQGLLVGMLPLFYGTFLAVLPAMLLALAWRIRGTRAAVLALALVLGFLAPTVLWVLVVRWHGGVFYSAEVETYRQFVWLLDAWQHGWPVLVARAGIVTTRFLAALRLALWFPLALLVLVTVWATALRLSLLEAIHAEGATVLAAVITFTSFALFLWALGIYPPRLAYNLAPPVLAVAGVLVLHALERASAPNARFLATVVGLASLGYLGFEVATLGH